MKRRPRRKARRRARAVIRRATGSAKRKTGKRHLPFTDLVLSLYKNPALVARYHKDPIAFLAAHRFLSRRQKRALYEGDIAGVADEMRSECTDAFLDLEPKPNGGLSGITGGTNWDDPWNP